MRDAPVLPARRHIHENVRAAMALRGVTGVQLARVAFGKDPSFVSRRSTGAVAWTASELAAVAEYLDVPIAALYEGVTPSPAPMVTEIPGQQRLLYAS